ncbi:MAG TPA: hypothetical protein VIF12_08175 [Micavibrio sp.]|jgi:hypothetical protein
MTLTDEEMVYRHQNETSAYKTIADYANAQRPGLLSRMRDHASRQNDPASHEALMHGFSKVAETKGVYSNKSAYADTIEGQDILTCLENFCRICAEGQDYALAACQAINSMKICQEKGIVADLDFDDEIDYRESVREASSETTDPAAIERNCLAEAISMIALAARQLECNNHLGAGHIAAIDILSNDLEQACDGVRGVKALPQSTRDCPETDLLQQFSAWLGLQQASKLILSNHLLSMAVNDGRNIDIPDFKAGDFYQRFCALLREDVAKAYESGLYVDKFSEASQSSPTSRNPEHVVPYAFLKEWIENEMDSWSPENFENGTASLEDRESFLLAANHLMKEFAEEFPLIGKSSGTPIPTIMLQPA